VHDESFDIVIACDVLEHVPSDLAAMRELHRILRPGGTAILTVPQKDSPATTDEDSSVTDPAERERRFGQRDHVRMFGDDFLDRLAKTGFKPAIVSIELFPAEIAKRHVLHPPISNKNPLATNQRRIYFAKKLSA
jgi:SAM-dependent methyltransferase